MKALLVCSLYVLAIGALAIAVAAMFKAQFGEGVAAFWLAVLLAAVATRFDDLRKK